MVHGVEAWPMHLSSVFRFIAISMYAGGLAMWTTPKKNSILLLYPQDACSEKKNGVPYISCSSYRENMLTSFSLHEPTAEASQTIESIMVPGTSMKLMPTHCLSSHGQLEGFVLNVPKREKGSVLPVNRTMFYGTSLFEVSSGAGVFNSDILRLQATDINERMRALQAEIYTRSSGKEATFACIPDVVDTMSAITTDGSVMEAKISRTSGRRSVDFKAWEPELPCSISILQGFIRASHQRDVRSHKLFIAVSGGLAKASDEFYNLLTDVGSEWTSQEVCDSEEVIF
jgi:hypothetical protein